MFVSDELLEGPRNNTVYYSIPNTNTDEDKQGKNFTKDEVEEMMKSDDYQRKIATCHLCRECWFNNSYSDNCCECGGYSLSRPCPICQGQCSQIWTRNIRSSHTYHQAYWDGTCKLPPDVQQAFFMRNVVDSSEQTLAEGMQDLSTC
ncbi:protein pinocchio-like [Octopus sinensis]|uniref:Protein pinocchio-like n=1 Tax=Octopus sinensis TaxID=2607531 RepID=A0A6P7SBD0_9MOLL|nr:protein pinocchio-like [Octopus sinensis]